MKIFIWVLFWLFVVSGCRRQVNIYRITKNGILSNNRVITDFSISQYKLDNDNLDDIRPKDHTEVMRYCCEVKPNKKGDYEVLFNDSNIKYRWFLCKLDTSIIANDSLNNLSLDHKFRYLRERDSTSLNTVNDGNKFPFSVKPGYVYQLFGLKGLEGSFYFRLDRSGQLLVQFVDKGPF